MPKRQIILLVLMGAAIIFGAANLFLGSGEKAQPVEARQEDLDKLTKQVDEMLASSKLTQVENYRLAILDGDGVTDPLAKATPEAEDQELASRTGDERFTYSAYLSIGGMELAVINDEECTLGDPVADTGYTLATLNRERAVVQGHNPESGTMEKVVIPIQEDIVTFPEASKPTEESNAN